MSIPRALSRLVGNFSLDKFRQQRQPFLPAEIASLRWYGCGHPFLRDVQFGSSFPASAPCSSAVSSDCRPPRSRLGSLLFLGPTGVGKTALSLEFSHFLFGGDSLFPCFVSICRKGRP